MFKRRPFVWTADISMFAPKPPHPVLSSSPVLETDREEAFFRYVEEHLYRKSSKRKIKKLHCRVLDVVGNRIVWFIQWVDPTTCVKSVVTDVFLKSYLPYQMLMIDYFTEHTKYFPNRLEDVLSCLNGVLINFPPEDSASLPVISSRLKMRDEEDDEMFSSKNCWPRSKVQSTEEADQISCDQNENVESAAGGLCLLPDLDAISSSSSNSFPISENYDFIPPIVSCIGPFEVASDSLENEKRALEEPNHVSTYCHYHLNEFIESHLYSS